ncbi:DNA repair protein RecN [Francisella adeliensis]|uniref:DNA repair protein RecN n=1 Tax=Francisella adeliensis TaxID=2007306 RepID=A0A2Z4Y1H0_9GAMM|nr:DNA repair protein RecN [Francisella adeliensis]AXA34776.1 DNA repair protein RecN [Francisella adeliensis]MBK2086355.1 DNA repair protein RecN [Francisella adeliensis]MBK2096570.1 DNA repair protein RecN [Francisella adeliensis]QIW12873.1 DNA repair protein RecN [Francisella adeliensis]QIW14875.1 DNA repair protein RecN [Francisella adeliensis]
MLLHLSIKNFAIIKSSEIDFKSAMTVLTGETGAGKSILLDALSFVLGARLEKSFLHEDDITEVSATFCIKDNHRAKELLDELFIDYDNECIFRRVVNKSKQSRLFINGSVARASDIQKISDRLINIYSQHSHQDLLNPKSQLNLLDTFASNDGLVTKVSNNFCELQKITAQIRNLEELVESQNSQKELLEYKLDELVALELDENEFEELSGKQKSLSSVDEVSYSLNYISNALYDNDENIISMLTQLEKETSKLIEDKSFETLADLITQTKVYAQEGYDEAQNKLGSLEQDPEELAQVETRMGQIYDLARKHKVEPSYLYGYIAELQAELESFSQENDSLNALKDREQQLLQEYLTQATKLTQARQKAAKDFSKQVEKNIRSLNIPKGSFVAQILPLDSKTAKGVDKCEFMINFNLGEQLAPVKKVASGGELSRIGLSIQAVSAEKRSYPTLVFDEVDVGISGGTAEIVGKLLKTLSQKLQILCITHQAQVAAQADCHLHVSKKYLKDTTESKIIELDQDQRIQEIAKIVGGIDISENTLKHARELLGVLE